MSRVPKNLSLERSAVARGERYGRLYRKSLSQLVNDFLSALPFKAPATADLSPLVRRLRGVAAGGKTGRDAYRKHLLRKYGGR